MKLKLRTLFTPLAVLMFLSSVAHAHPGHGPADLTTGFLHPLTGWDHLLAMVAVGLWAAPLGGRARWLLPATFVGAMTLGALMGQAGLTLPGLETGILVSVLLLGALVAGPVRIPLAAGLLLIAPLGFCHGLAHGAEMPAGAGAFIGGMVVATALLHAAGVGFGLLAVKRNAPALLRWTGAGIAAAGMIMVVVS